MRQLRIAVCLFGWALWGCFPGTAQNLSVATAFPGADPSVKINACIRAVIAAGGGTCDASGLGGARKMSEEIELGSTASVAARIGVTLLLPDTAVWAWRLTDGTSCAIRQYSSTALLGHQPGGGGNRMVFTADGGSNMDAIYCTDSPKIGANYVRAEGFAVWNNQANNTFKSGVIHIVDAVDQSSFARIFGENYYGDVWHVDSACCGARFETIHATSNGSVIKNGSKGGVPLTIGPGHVRAVSFYDASINQPGNGFPDILIKGGAGVMAVNFYDLYMEGNGATDPKTPMVLVGQGVGPIHFFGGLANTEQGHLMDTKTVIESRGAMIDVVGLEVGNTTLGINDHTANTTVPAKPFQGNLGSIETYRTKPAAAPK